MRFRKEGLLMSVDFKTSITKDNLMRAFAGESQARNRYTMAASQAKKEGLPVIEAVFTFTADQEKEHAQIFYEHLFRACWGNHHSGRGYPVDISQSVAQLLRYAQHNEYEEHNDVYKSFGEKALEEGFPKVAASFNMIAKIEKTHGDRFEKFADLLEQNKLFVADVETAWMCLECGNIYHGKEAPEKCPVCHHDRGYYIRLTMAPFEGE